MKKHKEEKIASRNERERIKQQLEQDKAERKMRGGKLAGKLGVDGYNPDCLQVSKRQTITTGEERAASFEPSYLAPPS